MEHFKLSTLYDTLETMKEAFKHTELQSEQVGIEHASGRFLAEDIVAREDLPGFNRASADGFAVVSGDTYGIGGAARAVFNQVGQSEAGKECTINLGPNECIYISAGAMMPANGDAVVSMDDSEVIGPLEVAINRQVDRWDNVIRKGDDLKKDEVFLRRGEKLRFNEVGALAGTGISHIKVFRKVHVSVISTGEEVIETFNTILHPGQTRDINSHLLCAALRNFGVVPVNKGIVKDNSRAMEETLEKSLEASDIVIISGGSSEGIMDKTLSVIKRIQDVELLTSRIGINPGKDCIVARVGNKAVFGLPGSPMSALITLNLLVKPLIMYLNKNDDKAAVLYAKCTRDYKIAPGKEEYVPVSIDKGEGEFTATPLTCKSGFATLLVKAEGYIKIRAADEGVKQSQEVEVTLF